MKKHTAAKGAHCYERSTFGIKMLMLYVSLIPRPRLSAWCG
jgi:hypothetical protein